MRFIKYVAVFLLGFLVAKFWFEYQEEEKHQTEEIKIVFQGIKNLSKLVVSEGDFSEMYSFTDSKKYFYNYFSFDKKALLSVNAKVEVGYDLSKLEIQIDSIGKQIIINKIPQEEISIIPDVKYFDLQESQFNSFSADELNDLNKKAIDNVKSSIMYTELEQKAKKRLLAELSKIYQLSKVYDWKVVDNSESNLLEQSGFKN